MQGVHSTAAGQRPDGAAGAMVPAGAAASAALLRWWQMAGVDTLVHAQPQPWLDAAAADAVDALPEAAPAAPVAPPPVAPAEDWSAFASLAELRTHVVAAQANIPFADGNPDAGLMLIGDAPSATDLNSGRPFSGPAGAMLDRMLAAIGLDRNHAYVALLCPRARAPGRPAPDAVAADLALTQAHIRLARPRLLLLLGANPVRALTAETAPIGRVRGNWLQVAAGDAVIPALATFNPAFLLRRPAEKAKAWADLLALKRRLVE